MHLAKLAEVGRLAAHVAHEINNPLMVVQGFAENIELMLDSDDICREEIRMQVLEILKSCTRMSRIVNNMNRMSRRQKLRMFVVDLAEIALSSTDCLKSKFQQSHVELEFDFESPIAIKCDAGQVEQIILNILSNALFALETANEEDKRIRISFQQVGEWQQIKIHNTGPAIPLDVQARLMTPFYTTKAEGQGTGLGLAVSKAIMQVHGGDLSFESREGFGTEFTLSFPRPKENPWEQKVRDDQGLIVVIDPAPHYRKTLQEKFRLLGFRVEAYPDYKSGMTALRAASKILGVFVDVLPNERESIDFVHGLRQALGPNGLIFATSNFPAIRNSVSQLKRMGATDYLDKPLHADNFVEILKLLDAEAKNENDTPAKIVA